MRRLEWVRRQWRSISLGGVLALLAALGGGAMVADHGGEAADRASAATAQVAFEEATGVRIVSLAVTAAGGMLDLRYRVLDPDKAVVVHDKDNPPTIIHEATNHSINKPFMHHSKGRDLHAAVTYYELLLNLGEVVRPGDAVTVVIGNARLAHVVAQ